MPRKRVKGPKVSPKGNVDILICIPATLEQKIAKQVEREGAMSRNEWIRHALQVVLNQASPNVAT
jgi:metal-responsive CopG/Arc/MetJ family transcriptional regulator